MKPSEAIRQRAAELFRERYMIAMPCMAPGEEAILEWIDAYTADQAGKRPGDPDTIAYNDLCDCGHIWGRHSSFSRCCNDGGCNCMLFEMRIKPDAYHDAPTDAEHTCILQHCKLGNRLKAACRACMRERAGRCQKSSSGSPGTGETPLYIPTAGEWVKVVAIAPFDALPAHGLAEYRYDATESTADSHPDWLCFWSVGKYGGTWCRVEPVCQCAIQDNVTVHDPDCKWLKWVESKRAAPVVEPVREPLHIHGDDAPVNQHDLDELLAERDTALAEVERLELERDEARAVISRSLHELGANHGSLVVGVRRLKGELYVVKQDRQQIRDQREAWERRESGLEASLATVERQLRVAVEDCAAAAKERDSALKREIAAESDYQSVKVESLRLREQLSTSNTEAERLRSELETAQQRLAEGIEVMNARQAAEREEIARLNGELATEQRNLTQLWRDVTNAWSRFSSDDCGTAEFHSTIRKLAERNPRSLPDQPAPLKEIRVGQTWIDENSDSLRFVTMVDINGVSYRRDDETVHFATFGDFRRHFTFVSDPPTPATVAGEEEGRR